MQLLKRSSLKFFEIGLGTAVFDLETRRLRDLSDQEITLRYRSREVLGVLARRRGEIVTRAELIEAAWDVTTVSDDSIAQCIADIRRAIADTDKRIVETVSRTGYRLVVPTGATGPAIGRQPPEARASVIAVLPFEDFGIAGIPAPAFRAVLSEAIITDLARYPEMKVLSRETSFGFSGAPQLDGVISPLRADYLVSGVIVSDGTRARISVRIISADDMSCIWVDEFDLDIGELLLLSRTIGRQVANVVGAKVIDMAEARVDRGEVSAMLIENAARSRMLRHVSAEAFHRNIREQEIALERYPDAAWGNFGQALALRTGIDNGWLRDDVDAACARAEQLVTRALELAPDNYLTHYALGKTLLGIGETERAILAFEHAAKLNPSSTMVLLGQIGPNLNLGNTARALELIAMSEQISPVRNRSLSYQKAKTYWHMGAPDQALQSLMASPGLTVEQTRLLAVVHVDLGHLQKSRDALKPFLTSNPRWSISSESEVEHAKGTPPALLERWISRLSVAGMPN